MTGNRQKPPQPPSKPAVPPRPSPSKPVSLPGRKPPPNPVQRAVTHTKPTAQVGLPPKPPAQAPASTVAQPPSNAPVKAPAAPQTPQAAQGSLSADQLFAMAKMAYTQWEYGKLDRARAIFQTLVTHRPNEPWFRCALGSIYQRQRQFAQAVQQYNIALQLDPKDIPSRVNRGEILLKVGKKQEAFQDLQVAIQADRSGKHPSALRAKSLLLALRGPQAPRKAP